MLSGDSWLASKHTEMLTLKCAVAIIHSRDPASVWDGPVRGEHQLLAPHPARACVCVGSSGTGSSSFEILEKQNEGHFMYILWACWCLHHKYCVIRTGVKTWGMTKVSLCSSKISEGKNKYLCINPYDIETFIHLAKSCPNTWFYSRICCLIFVLKKQKATAQFCMLEFSF